MSQQLIGLLKEIGRVKIELNSLGGSEDSEEKRSELQAQLDKLMVDHAKLMKGGRLEEPEDAKQAESAGAAPASFEEKERQFRAKPTAKNGGHRGELARLLERQRRKASEEGLNFSGGGAVSTADVLAESPQREVQAQQELTLQATEGSLKEQGQDLPGAVEGSAAARTSAAMVEAEEEAQVTFPPSPSSPASPAAWDPWDEDTMIIHHVLPGGLAAPEAASLESVAEPEQEEVVEEESGDIVPETRKSLGGRSMSGSSVRFQQEPDVVHFEAETSQKQECLQITSPDAMEPPSSTAEPATEAHEPEVAAEPLPRAAEAPATSEPPAEAEVPRPGDEPADAGQGLQEAQAEAPQAKAEVEAPKTEAQAEAPRLEAQAEAPQVDAEAEAPQVDAEAEAPQVEAEALEPETKEAKASEPSLAAAAELATAKTVPKAGGQEALAPGKAGSKATVEKQVEGAEAKRRPTAKAAAAVPPKTSPPRTAPPKAAPPKAVPPKAAGPSGAKAGAAAKAAPSAGRPAAAPKAAQQRSRSEDARAQRLPGSRRQSAEVSKTASDALSATQGDKPRPAWGGSGKLVVRPAAEAPRPSPRPKVLSTARSTKAASASDLRNALSKSGSSGPPPAQEKAPQAGARRVSEGQAALEKMAKDLEKNVKAAQARCLRESEQCAARHMKAVEAEAAAVRQAMVAQASSAKASSAKASSAKANSAKAARSFEASQPPPKQPAASPSKPPPSSEQKEPLPQPCSASELPATRSGSLRLALADLVQQEDTDDAQLAMAVQRVLGDSLPTSPSQASSRHTPTLTQSSPQLATPQMPLRTGSKPRSASGSPRNSLKELPKPKGASKKAAKSPPDNHEGHDSPRAGSPPRRSHQQAGKTPLPAKTTPRKTVEARPAWDDRFYVVEAKKPQVRKSELDEEAPPAEESEAPSRTSRSRSPTGAKHASQGETPEKRLASKAKAKSKMQARCAPASPEAQAQAAVSPRAQVPAERFAADRAVRQAGSSSGR